MNKLELRIKELEKENHDIYFEEKVQLRNAMYALDRKERDNKQTIKYYESLNKMSSVPTWSKEIHTSKFRYKPDWSEQIAWRLWTPKYDIRIYVTDRLNYKRDKYKCTVYASDNDGTYFMGEKFEPITEVFKTKEGAVGFAENNIKIFTEKLRPHLEEIEQLMTLKEEC